MSRSTEFPPPSPSAPPEFSRRIPLLTLRKGTEKTISATEDECAALARRFGLVRVASLQCRFRLVPSSDNVLAEGRLAAAVTQSCVITGEDVPVSLEENFTVRFVPREEMPDDLDLDIDSLLAEEVDDVPYDGHMIDVGEAASEQLALMLDPYPRKPGAFLAQGVDVVPPEEGETPDAEAKPANPFAVLSGLKGGRKGR